jgi:hypothetical protein
MRRTEFNKGFNPAVIKSLLIRMPKDEFIAYALFFGQLANDSEPGSGQYHFYMKLFAWCKRYYKKHFLYNRKYN